MCICPNEVIYLTTFDTYPIPLFGPLHRLLHLRIPPSHPHLPKNTTLVFKGVKLLTPRDPLIMSLLQVPSLHVEQAGGTEIKTELSAAGEGVGGLGWRRRNQCGGRHMAASLSTVSMLLRLRHGTVYLRYFHTPYSIAPILFLYLKHTHCVKRCQSTDTTRPAYHVSTASAFPPCGAGRRNRD